MKGMLKERALALLFPRRCPFCDRVIGFRSHCEDCEETLDDLWLKVPRLSFTEHHLENLSGAASVLKYEGDARAAVLRMKNGGRAAYAKSFAPEMARRIFGCTFRQKGGIILLESGPPLPMYDLVVPVPASPQSERGYNVPDLLAKPLAEYLNIPFVPDALIKIRQTEKQEGKSAEERLENVKNVYTVPNAQSVEGRRVLLVDDVITTGATVSECATQLLKAGANEVFAVSVAETQFKGKYMKEKA